MKTLFRITLFALLAVLALCFVTRGSAAEPAKKIKVLMLTGDDVAPAHNWAEVSRAIKETLVSSGKFDVKVCEDVGILDSAQSLAAYDVIFLHLYNAKTPAPSAAARQNLEKFVSEGKGFVVSHLSSASFKDWAEFRKMCGRYWVMGSSGHGPRSVFKAKIVKEHPITQGLKDFDADDELYAKLQGDAPIDILLDADSDWSKKTEPLAFTVSYGKGRVFHEAFGHDGKAIHNPSVTKLIQRGTEWAATGKVD
jgi:type 1 glutamine amidotransferase